MTTPQHFASRRFEVIERVGSGAMGQVFRAYDHESEQLVALKLTRGTAGDNERFDREARALQVLDHPAIVRYVDHGETENGELYLAMEWLVGETLAQRVRRTRVLPMDGVQIAIQLCSGLKEAHERGIIHRDIKPSNVFLVDRRIEGLKILDFGVARFLDSAQRLTESGLAIGTPGYMAPEQARGEAQLDQRVDLFAVGCVLYECITGRAAFTGVHLLSVLSKVLFDETPRLSNVWAEAPQALDRLLARLLAKTPDGRPSGAHEVIDELVPLSRALSLCDRAPKLESRTDAEEDDTVVERWSTPPPRRSLATIPPATRFPGVTHREQRVVTVLFVSPREAADDPKTLTFDRSEALAEMANRYGISYEVLADGSVVATLAKRHLPTDQAQSAARFALALRELYPEAGMALATGRGIFAEHIRLGPVVDRAVTLLHEIEEPAIALDRNSATLLEERFELEERENGTRLLGESQVPRARKLLGKTTRFVGREAELQAIRGIAEQCRADGCTRAIVLCAEAGAGKSRLLEELSASLGDDWRVLQGRGDSLGFGRPFSAVSSWLHVLAGIEPGEAAPIARRKLLRAVEARLGSDAGPLAAAFIGEALGYDFDERQHSALRRARGDAYRMGREIRAAWRRLIEVEADSGPLALLIDDVQWCDEPSAQLIDEIVRENRDSERAILAIVGGRPEWSERFPDFWENEPTTRLEIANLSERAADELIRHVAPELEPAMRAHLIARSGGNPFFLEELVRAAAHGQLVTLPETVIGMIQARLADLPAEGRQILRAASVFGKVFYLSAVNELVGAAPTDASVARWLQHLVADEVLAPGPRPAYQGEISFQFRHDLIHEAIYDMLPPIERARAHRFAGQWLERIGERDARQIARHFSLGEITAQAMRWYRRAAEDALETHDLTGAIDCAEQAIEHGADGELGGLLRLIQVEAHRWRGAFRDAERCAVDALQAFTPGSDAWFRAIGELTVMQGRFGRRDLNKWVDELQQVGLRETSPPPSEPQVMALAQASLRMLVRGHYAFCEEVMGSLEGMFDRLDSDSPAIVGLRQAGRGIFAFVRGQLETCCQMMDDSVELLERGQQTRFALMQRVHGVLGCYARGSYAEGLERFAQIVPLARSKNLVVVEQTGAIHSAAILARMGQLESARERITEPLAWFSEAGDVRNSELARLQLARISLELGDATTAAVMARESINQLALFPPLRAYAHAVATHALQALAAPEDAIAQAQQGLELLHPRLELDEHRPYLYLGAYRAQLSVGDPSAAADILEAARQFLTSRAESLSTPALQAQFWRVPENQALQAHFRS